MSTRAGLASLRRRFPGFEESLGRCVHEAAELCVEHKPVRGWIQVRPLDPNDPLPGRWVAFIHAVVTETKQEICLPVIPDEFNSRPDKIVRAGDTPHVFTYMSEAEEAANKELPGLIDYITSKL